jgi:ribose transport system substrate-binding protein
MRSFSLLAFFGLLGMSLAMVGCNRGGKSGDTSGKPKVAFVSNNAYQFWTFAERGAEKAAAEFGVQLVFKKPSDGSAKVQREIIQDLINSGYVGIAVSPSDSKNAVKFFKDQVASKVALVMTDNDLPDQAARKCYIGTHNYRAGRAAGELVKKALPGGGEVAIFVGQMDAQNAIERRQGVLDVLAGKDLKEMGEVTDKGGSSGDIDLGNGYKLIATKTDESKEEVCQAHAEDLLNKRPNVGCLVGLWEYNPPALLRAVKGSGRKVPIVAFDENDQTLAGIKNGSVVGTIVQDPYQFGYQSIKVLASLVKGNDDVLKTWPAIEAGNSIFVPHRVITKDNVDEFKAEVKKILSEK